MRFVSYPSLTPVPPRAGFLELLLSSKVPRLRGCSAGPMLRWVGELGIWKELGHFLSSADPKLFLVVGTVLPAASANSRFLHALLPVRDRRRYDAQSSALGNARRDRMSLFYFFRETNRSRNSGWRVGRERRGLSDPARAFGSSVGVQCTGTMSC